MTVDKYTKCVDQVQVVFINAKKREESGEKKTLWRRPVTPHLRRPS